MFQTTNQIIQKLGTSIIWPANLEYNDGSPAW